MQQPAPGHRRITLQTSTPSYAVRWDSEATRHASELHSIIEDLTFVAAACERARALHRKVDRAGNVRDQVGVQAYWDSAIVAYGRCFDSPGRLVLSEDDALAAGALEEHRRFMDMRHLHVAHRIDPHWERSAAAILLSAKDAAQREVLGVSLLYAKMISAQPAQLEDLRRVALLLRGPVVNAEQRAMSEIATEARARPIAELYDLPATSTPDVETKPMRSLRRKLKRRSRSR